MANELSKKEIPIALKLIEKAANAEFSQALKETDQMIQRWKKNETNENDTFHLIYQNIAEFNKYMARKYGVLKPSIYFDLLVNSLSQKWITETDLDDLTEKTKSEILKIVKERESEKFGFSPGLD